MSNLRSLVVRWLENITRATRSSCARARDATSRSTSAAAVSPGGVTAATAAARTRGTRACAELRASTTIGIPMRGRRCIGSRRRTGARVDPQIPWGITAAARNPESYEYRPRRCFTPSGRPMPLSSNTLRCPLDSSGSWSRGRSCSRPPADDWAPRRAVPSAGGKVESSRSCPSSGGGDGRAVARTLDV